MQQITLRLPDGMVDELEAEADEHGTSRSGYIRDVLESRGEHSGMADEHAKRIEELEQEVERVRREKRQLLEQREEHSELVRAVQEERSDQQRKNRAGLGTRLKWWLVGMDDE